MKQYNTFVVFKRPLLCCLATFSDGTLRRERKVTLMKHSDMNVKKMFVKLVKLYACFHELKLLSDFPLLASNVLPEKTKTE